MWTSSWDKSVCIWLVTRTQETSENTVEEPSAPLVRSNSTTPQYETPLQKSIHEQHALVERKRQEIEERKKQLSKTKGEMEERTRALEEKKSYLAKLQMQHGL